MKRTTARMSSLHARALRGALAAMCLLAGIGTAVADSCRQLEGQLAALAPGSRANPQQIARYDAAIVSQQNELAKARTQQRQSGCGSGSRGPVCAALDTTVQRMNANMANLRASRERLAASGVVRAERRRIEAALRSCQANASAQRRASQPAEQRQETTEPRSSTRVSVGGNPGQRFRTLCVRMCDGYFFPISHSTPRGLFERDERLCAARCPGTAVELHFHRFPGQESHEMVSVPTGEPYRDSQNAFLYRQTNWERPETCGCGVSRGFDVLAGSEHEGGDQTTAAIASPEAGTMHETGSFLIRESVPAMQDAARTTRPAAEPESALVVQPAQSAIDSEMEEPVERRVRVVGPTFLPAPEEAIDLRARDPLRAR